MSTLLLQLLIAHIIGDFALQPDKWVHHKKKKKHLSPYLYLHLGVHTLALLLLLQFDSRYWLGIIAIVASHFLVDLTKLHLTEKINARLLFIADQLVHIAIIIGVVYAYQPNALQFDFLYSPKVLLLVLSLLMVTSVSMVIMKLAMSRWSLIEDNSKDSLQDAGKYIGVLERLFVFGFIVLNQWQAIGLLIAAKSVFRFGDLSKAKDRKLTEYILIGTLLSFGLAIVTGLAYIYGLKHWL